MTDATAVTSAVNCTGLPGVATKIEPQRAPIFMISLNATRRYSACCESGYRVAEITLKGTDLFGNHPPQRPINGAGSLGSIPFFFDNPARYKLKQCAVTDSPEADRNAAAALGFDGHVNA
jgi:hypothetical protein